MAQVTLPYTLTPGTPENVSNLMSNLTALRDGVNTIDTAQLAADAVTAAKIKDGEVGTAELASSAVTNAKLAGPVAAQVVQAAKTDTFTTSSSTATDVTGISVNITPTLSTSKVLVLVDLAVGTDQASYTSFFKLVRDSTAIFVGDAAGNRQQVSTSQGGNITNQQYEIQRHTMMYLDSPASTSQLTYKVQAFSGTGSNAVYINRTGVDGNTSGYGRFASSITAIEVRQ